MASSAAEAALVEAERKQAKNGALLNILTMMQMEDFAEYKDELKAKAIEAAGLGEGKSRYRV